MDKGLTKKVNEFLRGFGDLVYMDKLLSELVLKRDSSSLDLVIKMAQSDYGGITYKGEFQTFSCLASIYWGKKGIEALANMVMNNPSYRNLLNVSYLLAHVASMKLGVYPRPFNRKKSLLLKIDDLTQIASSREVVDKAKHSLVEIMTDVNKNELFPIGLTTVLQYPGDPKVQQAQFAALVTRWFHFSKAGNNEYFKLIHQKFEEEVYHSFLKNNKNLLDPFTSQVWSKPKFGEGLVPDFLIRSMDDTYTVVEIEKPWMKITTKKGNLSAETTHAKRQVLDYQDWLIKNHLYAKDKYPNLSKPHGLVVIGLESSLSDKQREQLRKENESTAGSLKVVGFDWLYNRAQAIFDNMTRFAFERLNES